MVPRVWYLYVTKTYPRLSVALSPASSSLACDKKKKKKFAQCAEFDLRFSPAASDLADKLRRLLRKDPLASCFVTRFCVACVELLFLKLNCYCVLLKKPWRLAVRSALFI